MLSDLLLTLVALTVGLIGGRLLCWYLLHDLPPVSQEEREA
jgi:hypothetical protein